MYLVVKALHIIFVVTWFAGLFYMFRLFVYHVEAAARPEPACTVLLDQFKRMEKRLWYIITWPSCILTLILGPWMLILNPDLLSQPWMHLKLFFVLCLISYQWFGHSVFRRLQNEPAAYTSFRLRLWNEVGTLLLVAIVFLVVLRDSVSWVWGSLGLVGTGFILAFFARAYKSRREKMEQK